MILYCSPVVFADKGPWVEKKKEGLFTVTGDLISRSNRLGGMLKDRKGRCSIKVSGQNQKQRTTCL